MTCLISLQSVLFFYSLHFLEDKTEYLNYSKGLKIVKYLERNHSKFLPVRISLK